MSMMFTELENSVDARFHEIRPDIERCFDALWAEAELPCLEFNSAEYLANWLELEGFDVERNAGGLPTAFKASWQHEPGPCVMLLAEYDALQGPNNEATPFRSQTDKRSGHGCGHNHIGGLTAGAAIAVRRAFEDLQLPGRITVVGCPAEEIVWGKIALMKQSVFQDADALLAAHCDYQNGAINRPCQSVVHGEFVFLGESGHAGESEKSSTVEALELFVQTIMRVRATDFPDTSIRYVIRNGGDMPTVLPDEVRVWISARHPDFVRARSAYELIESIAVKVTKEFGVAHKHQFISETHGYLPNDMLAETILNNLVKVGSPKWSNEDLNWQRQLVSACQPNGDFTLDKGIDIYTDGCDSYGQDDGELSWYIPLGRINWAIPDQIPLHHWACTALSGNPAGFAGPLMASNVLALTAAELMTDPDIIGKSKAELAKRTETIDREPARLGAINTLTRSPKTFWDGTWFE